MKSAVLCKTYSPRHQAELCSVGTDRKTFPACTQGWSPPHAAGSAPCCRSDGRHCSTGRPIPAHHKVNNKKHQWSRSCTDNNKRVSVQKLNREGLSKHTTVPRSSSETPQEDFATVTLKMPKPQICVQHLSPTHPGSSAVWRCQQSVLLYHTISYKSSAAAYL